MKKLYCFDFDGTITKHDTMFMFLKFYARKKFYIQFIRFIPLFVLVKLKLANTEKIKKSFIKSIIGGESKEKIEKSSNDFFSKNFPDIIRSKALEYIENVDRSDTDCFIVTASLDCWVKSFSEHFNMKLIATEARYENDVFTGDFQTNNCTGKEKVNRLMKVVEGKKYYKTVAFGDSQGDKEMLAWADESYYRKF